MRTLTPVVMALTVALTATACSTMKIVEPGTTSPPATATTNPTPPTTGPPTTGAPDSPDVVGFIEEWTTALATDDVGALVATLHPAARELYGLDRCRDFVAVIAPASPVITPQTEESTRLEVERDGHLVAVESGWQMLLDDTGAALFPSGLVVGVDESGSFGWLPDCGRALLTVDPEGLVIITITGDTLSAPFDTPDSWRIEAAASSSCEVLLLDIDSGTTESLGRDDASFLVQRAGRGGFQIRTIGCSQVAVIENTAEN